MEMEIISKQYHNNTIITFVAIFFSSQSFSINP